eukprot:1158085-Pelagomonas_calceolata.AAC.7
MSKEDVPAASRAQPWRTSMWDCEWTVRASVCNALARYLLPTACLLQSRGLCCSIIQSSPHACTRRLLPQAATRIRAFTACCGAAWAASGAV